MGSCVLACNNVFFFFSNKRSGLMQNLKVKNFGVSFYKINTNPVKKQMVAIVLKIEIRVNNGTV